MVVLIAAFVLALIGVIAVRLISPAVNRRKAESTTPVVADPIEKALPKPIKKLPNLLNLDELSRPTDPEVVERMKRDKELYHKLQNLEDNLGQSILPSPDSADGLDAISSARDRLVELFDITISEAQASPAGTILAIPKYDPAAVEKLLDDAHQANLKRYERYIARRRAKGPRELFVDAEYAKKWLRLASMVKFVDGGWIGAIVNSLPLLNDPTLRDTGMERAAGKIAWQVISEEFGDGDLEKNHVYLYEKLISQLNTTDGRSSSSGFQPHFDGTAPEEGVPNCWTAAIAQQCIGLLSSPEDYFQEALGFNMAYECLAYHLLITSYELRELKVDNYYFNLHITIDNPSTGHSAMARVAVEKYMEGLLARDGPEAVERAWKKIQAGFILAEGLPTTPTKPVDGGDISKINTTPPASTTTLAFADLICHKAVGSAQIHCASRLKFGGKTVEQWLDPTKLTQASAVDFANILAEKPVWVVPGHPEKSRMVKELEWGGRMFGAFSRMEVETVRAWVKHLDTKPTAPTGVYFKHIEHDSPPRLDQISSTTIPTPIKHSLLPALTLWMISLTLLDHFQLSPAKFATPLGTIILRIQRAQLGFISLHRPEDLCEGNDTDFDHTAAVGMWELASKLWLEITGQNPGRDLHQLAQVGGVADDFVQKVLGLRQRPYANARVLMGMTKAFIGAIHEHPALAKQLGVVDQGLLKRMVRDEQEAVDQWVSDMTKDDPMGEYQKGVIMAEQVVRESTHGVLAW